MFNKSFNNIILLSSFSNLYNSSELHIEEWMLVRTKVGIDRGPQLELIFTYFSLSRWFSWW